MADSSQTGIRYLPEEVWGITPGISIDEKSRAISEGNLGIKDGTVNTPNTIDDIKNEVFDVAYTSDTFALNSNIVDSASITPNRQRLGVVETSLSVEGSLSIEYTINGYNDLIASVLGGDLLEINVPIGEVKGTSNTLVVSKSDSTHLLPQMILRIKRTDEAVTTGSSANIDKIVRIKTITVDSTDSTKYNVVVESTDETPLVLTNRAESSTNPGISLKGKIIRNGTVRNSDDTGYVSAGAFNDKSFTIYKRYGPGVSGTAAGGMGIGDPADFDPDGSYSIYRGMLPTSFSLNSSADSILTSEIAFLGRDLVNNSVTDGNPYPDPFNGGTLQDGEYVNDFTREEVIPYQNVEGLTFQLYESDGSDGKKIFPFANTIDVSFTKNAESRQAVGHKFPIGVRFGFFDIEMNPNLYYTSEIYQQIVNKTDFGASFHVRNTRDERTYFDIFRGLGTGGDPQTSDGESDVFVSMTIRGQVDERSDNQGGTNRMVQVCIID